LTGLQYIFQKGNMGTGNILVSFPEELGFALKMQQPELADEMRRMAIIKLYELGKLSSGKAAQLLGISRVAFLELVGTYQVSILGNPGKEQLEEDLMNA
jgi:predicted HTH domain antitoxin